MKKVFENLGDNPKFDTLVKLAFYSLFVFGAIILINTADIDDLNDNENDDNSQTVNQIIFKIPDNYDYKYSISIDDKIYSYEGIIENNVNTFKKNIDNVIKNYKFENGSYYIFEKEEYVETLEDNVYDIISYDYLDVKKIKQYLDNGKENDGKYYVYLKDQITGENTNEYIIIELDENEVRVDYSNLEDEYNKLLVVFEYEERKVEGEM